MRLKAKMFMYRLQSQVRFFIYIPLDSRDKSSILKDDDKDFGSANGEVTSLMSWTPKANPAISMAELN